MVSPQKIKDGELAKRFQNERGGHDWIIPEMAPEEKFIADNFVGSLRLVGEQLRLLEEEKRRLHRHEADEVVRAEGLKFRSILCGIASNFTIHVFFDFPDGPDFAQFLVIKGDADGFLDEDDDFHHRQGVDAEVFNEAQGVIPFLQLRSQFRFEESLHDTHDDGGYLFRITGFAVGQSSFKSTFGASAEGFFELLNFLFLNQLLGHGM